MVALFLTFVGFSVFSKGDGWGIFLMFSLSIGMIAIFDAFVVVENDALIISDILKFLSKIGI